MSEKIEEERERILGGADGGGRLDVASKTRQNRGRVPGPQVRSSLKLPPVCLRLYLHQQEQLTGTHSQPF